MPVLEQHRKDLSAFPLFDKVIEEGQVLAAELSEADAMQEGKRISMLPEAVRNFCAAKGRLFAAVKIVSEAGRAAFVRQRAVADRINLSILRRRPGKRPGEEAIEERPAA